MFTFDAFERMWRSVRGNIPLEVAVYPWDVVVQGTTTAHVKAARDAIIASKGSTIGPAMKRMIFPPGEYNITENDALMLPGSGTNNEGFNGLWIQGAGIGSTTLKFTPSSTSDSKMVVDGTPVGDPSVGNLFGANSRTRWLLISDMTIESTNTLANAFWFYRDGSTSAQNQAMRFQRLNFKGSWQRVFGFDGGATANQNSEVSFSEITTNGTPVYHDAFCKVGGISGVHNQQNQMLNHWWDNCQFYLAGGDLWHYRKGGHASFKDISASSWESASPAMTWIRLGNNLNNLAAAQFQFENIRFEPKAIDHTVLNSQLTHGSVSFKHCTDQSSLGASTAAYDWPLYKVKGERIWGSLDMHADITWEHCHNTGYVDYQPDASHLSPADRGHLTFRNNKWYRGGNHVLALPTQTQGAQAILRWPAGLDPRYVFENNNTANRVYTNIA